MKLDKVQLLNLNNRDNAKNKINFGWNLPLHQKNEAYTKLFSMPVDLLIKQLDGSLVPKYSQNINTPLKQAADFFNKLIEVLNSKKTGLKESCADALGLNENDFERSFADAQFQKIVSSVEKSGQFDSFLSRMFDGLYSKEEKIVQEPNLLENWLKSDNVVEVETKTTKPKASKASGKKQSNKPKDIIPQEVDPRQEEINAIRAEKSNSPKVMEARKNIHKLTQEISSLGNQITKMRRKSGSLSSQINNLGVQKEALLKSNKQNENVNDIEKLISRRRKNLNELLSDSDNLQFNSKKIANLEKVIQNLTTKKNYFASRDNVEQIHELQNLERELIQTKEDIDLRLAAFLDARSEKRVELKKLETFMDNFLNSSITEESGNTLLSMLNGIKEGILSGKIIPKKAFQNDFTKTVKVPKPPKTPRVEIKEPEKIKNIFKKIESGNKANSSSNSEVVPPETEKKVRNKRVKKPVEQNQADAPKLDKRQRRRMVRNAIVYPEGRSPFLTKNPQEIIIKNDGQPREVLQNELKKKQEILALNNGLRLLENENEKLRRYYEEVVNIGTAKHPIHKTQKIDYQKKIRLLKKAKAKLAEFTIPKEYQKRYVAWNNKYDLLQYGKQQSAKYQKNLKKIEELRKELQKYAD